MSIEIMFDDGGGPFTNYATRAPILIGIVDTNVLLSSVDNDCRHEGRRSHLLRMCARGEVLLYAARHVLDEFYEKLPKFAKSTGGDRAAFQSHFEVHYLRLLRFVEMSDLDPSDAQVDAITDPDDVPTGQLANLIRPCVVFSDDKHLKAPGFAPRRWLDPAAAATRTTEARQQQLTATGVTVLPFKAVSELLKFGSRTSGIPGWVLWGAAAGAGALLLKQPSRREAFLDGLWATAEYLSTQFASAAAAERDGLEMMQAAVLSPLPNPTARQRVARVLAKQSQPLLAGEIRNLALVESPDESWIRVNSVRQILEEGSEFVRVDRYRWTLGSEAH